MWNSEWYRPLSEGPIERIIAMKDRYLVTALFVVCAVAIGIEANSIRAGGDYCPNPSAASVTALFAPCQTFDTSMGGEVAKQEALHLGLLTPEERPIPRTQLAARW
jgi:hypothetical protein